MGATTKASSRVGMPICWMFCALRVRDETEFAGGRRATHSSAKLTKKRTARVSIAFHLQAPASPIKTPEQQKRNLRLPTLRSRAIAAVYATKLHIRKTIKNASIMPTRDITKRKLLQRVSPAAKRASRESRKSRRVQRYTAGKVSAPQNAAATRQPKGLSPAAFMPMAMIIFPKGGLAKGGGIWVLGFGVFRRQVLYSGKK